MSVHTYLTASQTASHKSTTAEYGLTTNLACRAGVYLAIERSVCLRAMCGRHLRFLKERKVGGEKEMVARRTIASL